MKTIINTTFSSPGNQLILNLLVRILGLGIGFLSDVLFARLLKPEQYGSFQLVLSVLSVIGVVSMVGLPRALVKAIGSNSGNNESIVKSLNLAIVCVAAAAAIGAFFLSVGFPYLAGAIFHKPHLAPYSVAASLQLLLFSLCSIWVSTLEGLGISSIGYFVREVLSRLFKLIVFLCFGALMGMSGLVLMWSFCIGQLLVLGVYTFLIQKIAGKIFSLSSIMRAGFPEKDQRKSYFSLSSTLIINSIIGMLMIHASKFILAQHTEVGEIGLYSVALNLSGLIIFALGSVNAVILPVAARMFEIGDLHKLRKIYQFITNIITVLTIPLFSIFILVPGSVLQIYGAEYLGASECLIWLSIALFITSVTGPNYPFLIMSRDHRFESLVTCLAGLSNVAFCFLLIPRLGIQGAAIAYLLARLSENIFRSWKLYRSYKLSHFRAEYFNFLILMPTLYVLKKMIMRWHLLPVANCAIVFFISGLVAVTIYCLFVMNRYEKKFVMEEIEKFKTVLRL